MSNPRKGLATGHPSSTSPARIPSALRLLRDSIDDQIEALILRHPDCPRAVSLNVDRLLLTAEAFGGQW